MDGAIQKRPEEPGAAAQPCSRGGNSWLGDGEGDSSEFRCGSIRIVQRGV